MAEKLVELGTWEVLNIKNLEENMQILKKKVEFLSSREADVRTTLEGTELVQGKKRKREVETWLSRVDEKRGQIDSLDQEVRQTRFHHVISRRRLAKIVAKMIAEIDELIEQGSFPEGLLIDASSENVPLVISEANGVAFEYNLKNILSCVMDQNEVFSLGIYGMGGVGKTTLAMQIHDKLLKKPKYPCHVYWATVSQEFDSHKLQNDIAQGLKLNLSIETDDKRRAALLFQKLNEIQKFVLILDDVWKPFSLEKIGIPIRTDGCKLLITSRSVDACRAIGCQKLIKVETLSEAESWILFEEKLRIGHSQSFKPEVEEIARKVARRCGGLPLGIITMAGIMRGVDDIHDWKDVLEEMKASSSMGLENMGSDVFPILLCSYNRLGNPKLQRCFLYCCLYPEDYKIERGELISKFKLEDLMDKRRSRQAYYDQGHAILNKLENVCLLEGVQLEGKKHVKMHDLVREMGLWITRDTYMVKAGLQLEQIPPLQDWTENLSKVSLMLNNIRHIPSFGDASTPKSCRNLSTLFVNWNKSLLFIPDSFFMCMPNLEILDLSCTGINKLPDSVSVLKNLKALLLSHCYKLKHLPSLENLKALREIELSSTNIDEIIMGIEKLTNLESLDLSGIKRNVIPFESLRRLPRLQRLILYYESIEMEEQAIEGFMQLEEFGGAFCNICDLNRFMKSAQHCHTYEVYVGCQVSVQMRMEHRKRTLKIEKCNLTEIGSQEEIMLPRNIQVLRVCDCEEIECIVKLSSGGALEMEAIQTTLGDIMLPTLGKIEELYLFKLPAFEGLIKWELPLQSVATLPHPSLPIATFSCLRELRIRRCESLKVVIPTHYFLDYLKNLEILDIETCKQIEEIIGGGGIEDPPRHHHRGKDNHNDAVSLPKLREFNLYRLPELKNICKHMMICDSRTRIHMKDCEKVKQVPIILDRIEELRLDSLPEFEGLIKWELQLSFAATLANPLSPTGRFTCLKMLWIRHCKKIKVIASPNLLDYIQNLEHLQIEECEQIEEIIEGNNSNHARRVSLPRLREFHLIQLPELKIIHNQIIMCDSIQTISIWNCDKLKQVPILLGGIEQLDLRELPEFEGPIEWELSLSLVATLPRPPLRATTFSFLRWLMISLCKRLKVVIQTRNMLDYIQNLEFLSVRECEQIEEIIGGGRVEEDPPQHYNGNHERRVGLPRLRELDLVQLPKLKSICNQTMICDSLRTISIRNCDELKKVPILLDAQSMITVTLESDKRGSQWIESLEWANA